MKRFITILVYLLTATLLFSAPGDKQTVSDEKITIKVKGGISDQKFIGVGFSTSSVDDWVMVPGPLKSDTIALNTKYTAENDVIAEYGDNNLFIYWKLLTSHTIEIWMTILAPLSNGKDTPINWNVSWSEVLIDSKKLERHIDIDSDSATGDIPSTKMLKNFIKDTTLKAVVGSLPLTIKTESLLDKDLTATYTGTLQIKMVVK